ncbi:hypothetical protein LCGC14_2505980 [marine sediment metagenome]|uniref:HNH nuclease domain-containing protein n=1 Tax=marine sediment metagenome TaxID=412755 RepID=A0A0F9B186_9ZZZZ
MRTIEQRLEHYSIPVDGHLLWCGASSNDGYGNIRVDGKTVLTHRLVWELEYGPIPAGAHVLHLCPGEPHACIEPTHLYLGDNFDNQQDRLRAGNHYQVNKTHCIHGHAFDKENTYYRLRASGGRSCRACFRHWAKNSRSRRQAEAVRIG